MQAAFRCLPEAIFDDFGSLMVSKMAPHGTNMVSDTVSESDSVFPSIFHGFILHIVVILKIRRQSQKLACLAACAVKVR